MKRISTHFGKSVFTLAVIAVIATLMMLAACISGTVPGTSSGAGFPYIQSITAQIVSGPATPGATSGATSAATPGATASVTPGATSAATPGATGATSAATPGATASAMPGATSAATPGATSAATPGATSAATPGATSTATPGATSTPTTGGANVMISIQAANFTVVNNMGQAPVAGQGHVHYYMDATPPISAGLPAVSAPGTVVEIAATSYTWPNVQPGLHVFSVQLVNNDHTPLSAPAVAAVLCVVPSTTGAAAPAITMYTTQIMPSAGAAASPTPGATTTATPGATSAATPGATSAATPGATGATGAATPGATSAVTPGATSAATPGATSAVTPGATAAATPGATASPSPTATAAAGAGGVSIMQMIQVSNFSIVDRQGQAAAVGQGHVHFYLDSIPATFPNIPAIGSGNWAHVAATSYTWNNVPPGVHLLSVELVNNDHTPLNPPVVQVSEVVVMPSGAAASPTPSRAPSPTASPTASPAASPSPTAAASPSPTASPAASPTSTAAAGGPVTINLVAQNIAFNMSTITVRAGAQVTVNFNNMDSGIPHNFAVYTNQSASTVIFRGNIITGPATTTYNFTAPATPGTYYFQCDPHASIMNGQFIVQ